MARGIDGKNIFETQEEWRGFFEIIRKVKETCPFRLFAYCPMSNHFHLLLQVEDVSISRLMHRIMTIHSKRYNLSRGRTGHVFQSRFKAKLVENDAYLLHLIRYVHLNPVKAGIVERPERWPWSGHRELIGFAEVSLIDTTAVFSLFDQDIEKAKVRYKKYILEGLDDPAAMLPEPPDLAPSKVASKLKLKRPDFQSIDQLAQYISSKENVPVEAWTGQGRSRVISSTRRSFIAAAYLAGHTFTSIATFLSISPSAASRAFEKYNKSQKSMPGT